MSQSWCAENYAKNGRFVADLADGVVSLLQPQRGERILDLGCGDGALTEKLHTAGAQVLGVDSSPEMVEATRHRGLRAEQGSGEQLAFASEFDAVFSNAALHWMRNQEAVLSGVFRALRPGGRFVAEMGGHGNIAAIRTALRAAVAPYGIEAEEVGSNVFFTPAEYQALLEQQGFVVSSMQLIPRPTLLPTGLRSWMETFREGLLSRLPAETRARVLDEVTDQLRPILCDSAGQWWADYVRLRFSARKPESASA